MYFGNPAAASLANAPNTWPTSTYGAVWHFGTSSAISLSDSTSNGYNVAQTGPSNVPAIAGQINGGANFAANLGNSSLQIQVPSNGGVNVFNPGSSPFSITSWVNPNASTLATEQPVLVYGSTADNNGIAFVYGANGGDCTITGSVCLYDSNTTSGAVGPMTTGIWQQIGVVKSGTTTTFYLNGAIIGTDIAQSSITSETNTLNPYLGEDIGDGSTYLNGSMDEPEFSITSLTPGWILTEYNNQNSPSTFYTVGSVENANYAPALSTVLRHGQSFGTVGNQTGVLQPFTW